MYDYFMDKPHVLPRMNRHVLEKSQVFDLSYPSKGLLRILVDPG